jgi:WD40 repeat protein
MSFNTAVSPHLDRLAVQLGNGRVKVWDIGRRPRLATSVLPQSNVIDLCFSPDGRLLATQDEQGEVAIFDTRKPVALGRVLAAPNANRLSFSPDGRLLSAGSDSRVVIWSTADWRITRSLPRRAFRGFFSCSWPRRQRRSPSFPFRPALPARRLGSS